MAKNAEQYPCFQPNKYLGYHLCEILAVVWKTVMIVKPRGLLFHVGDQLVWGRRNAPLIGYTERRLGDLDCI